jgi:hypothetical protein
VLSGREFATAGYAVLLLEAVAQDVERALSHIVEECLHVLLCLRVARPGHDEVPINSSQSEVSLIVQHVYEERPLRRGLWVGNRQPGEALVV